MNNRMRSLLRWGRNLLAVILVLIAATMVWLRVQAALRETKTRIEAAPTTGRFIQAGDTELFIQELGPSSGPAVVFIHGAGAWSELWREAMAPLAEAGFHCIAIDLPPFGFSERSETAAYGRVDQARRIIATLDVLQIDQATLIGHSFGGGATVETAMLIPDRIQAMVLADIGGLGLSGDPPQPRSQRSLLTSLFAVRPVRNTVVAATLTNPLLTQTILETLILDPTDATEERIRIVQRPLVLRESTNDLGDWLFATLTSQEVSLTSDPANYQTLTMPILLVWGESDTTVPVAEGRYLETLFPSAELEIMPQVNHIPQIEDPAQFNALVKNFLGKLHGHAQRGLLRHSATAIHGAVAFAPHEVGFGDHLRRHVGAEAGLSGVIPIFTCAFHRATSHLPSAGTGTDAQHSCTVRDSFRHRGPPTLVCGYQARRLAWCKPTFDPLDRTCSRARRRPDYCNPL